MFIAVGTWCAAMPKYGPALQERREVVGYRTQSDLARATRSLEEEGHLPNDLKSFSQQWLSILEDDKNGQHILSARSRQIRALAYMLRWTAKDFEENVGISIGNVPDSEFSTDISDSNGVNSKIDNIPITLLEAVSTFGKYEEWADLREESWQNLLTRLNYRHPPKTSRDWLTIYLNLRDKIYP